MSIGERVLLRVLRDPLMNVLWSEKYMYKTLIYFYLFYMGLYGIKMDAMRAQYAERSVIQSEDQEYAQDFDTSTMYGLSEDRNTYELEVEDKRRPEVTAVRLIDASGKGQIKTPRISNQYGINYLHSGVVGLVGIPVEVGYDESLETAQLQFQYDKEQLNGVPERNLLVLKYNEKDGGYDILPGEKLDTEKATVTVDIKEPGVYMLADRYLWYSCWGIEGAEEYAYEIDPTKQVSAWERECNTGSILEIADKDWAMENAPIFRCSTPEQLAGATYYVNAVAQGWIDVEIYLEDDINLEGYEWVPLGWVEVNNVSFYGLVDGQGHKISNMHIVGHDHSAFIAHSTSVKVQNITFENATIEAGSYAGIVGAEIYDRVAWENVHVQGTIHGYCDEIGSIVGREGGITFRNCTADVDCEKRDGSITHLEYFSHRQEVVERDSKEDFTLTQKNGVVTRNQLENEDSYWNLMWHVEVDGVQVLEGGNTEELSRDFSDYTKGAKDSCQVWLVAHNGEYYVRVSNVVDLK